MHIFQLRKRLKVRRLYRDHCILIRPREPTLKSVLNLAIFKLIFLLVAIFQYCSYLSSFFLLFPETCGSVTFMRTCKLAAKGQFFRVFPTLLLTIVIFLVKRIAVHTVALFILRCVALQNSFLQFFTYLK
jgi:hypothetical protein